MMRITRRAALVAALLAPVVGGAQARTEGSTSSGADFRWSGAVTKGAWVRVHNVNGGVVVEPGTGDALEITATKRTRRGNPEDVRIELVRGGEGGGDVIVCALWSERATCGERGSRNNNINSDDDDGRGDVSVEFRVRLPAGVRVQASTVNGKVRVDGATAEVDANTVNGGIEASSTSGPVRARSVNGSIDVRMAQLGTESLDYSTVNGSMNIRIPANASAEIELSTVNGSLESDFPLTMQGRMDRHNIRARLGNGGPRLSFRTVNGSVHLLRN